jgi:hypothetical protein
LTKFWGQAQHARTPDPDEKTNNGSAWAAAVSSFFLEQWLDLWKLRNEDRHGRDAGSTAEAEKDQVHREVTPVCGQCSGMELPQHLQFVMAKPLAEQLKLPTHVLKVWVTIVRPLSEKETETDYSEDLAAGQLVSSGAGPQPAKSKSPSSSTTIFPFLPTSKLLISLFHFSLGTGPLSWESRPDWERTFHWSGIRCGI